MPTRPETHGTATISHGGRLLIITTTGKKAASTLYVVEDCRPDKSIADPAYRIYKSTGEAYTVHEDKFGIHCTCPDFHWVRDRSRQTCKHLKAALAVGLLKEKP